VTDEFVRQFEAHVIVQCELKRLSETPLWALGGLDYLQPGPNDATDQEQE
jgi:hypothetical protein